MMKKKYVLFWLTIFMTKSLLAATFYVSTTGNDSGDGSITSPFATFNKVVSVMNAGDTCIIRAGVYEEELVINKSGSDGNYLTFKAAAGEAVEIKSTSVINGWQLHTGNIYKTTVNMSIASRFRAVYHNGNYMDLARWPNNLDNNRWTIDCTPVTGGNGSHFLVNNVPDIDWTGGYVYYLGSHSGTSWTREITASTTNRVDYTEVNISKWPFVMHNPSFKRNIPGNYHGQLFLFNKLEALDAPREWFFDEATNILYLQTQDGNIPAINSVEYAVRKYTAELKGDYIKLDGITFSGGSVKIYNKADNNQMLNCKVLHGSEGHDNLSNRSAQVAEAAIEVLGDNTLIKGCEINHSSVSGIYLPGWAASNCIVEGNTVSNTDYLGIHASPIRTNGKNIKILKNRVFNTGRDGMYVAGSNCEVAYNDVSGSQKINSDSGVFYTVGNANLKNTEIHHNWLHDATAPAYSHNSRNSAKAAGIYLDNNSKGYTVHHNVVWNVSWVGYVVNWNNTNLDFYHNTIWNASGAMVSWVNGYPQSDNKIYNNYSSTGTWFEGNGASEFEIKDSPIFNTSPFEDVDNQNFMPTVASALVDQGPVIPGFEKSFIGSAADIGAYERGGVAWTAGINAVEDVKSTVEPKITITSKPSLVAFDDLSNPSKISTDIDFKLRINNLDPAKTYNLLSRIVNQSTGVEIALFKQQNINGVFSTMVDLNWLNFPNNPVVINSKDKFQWTNVLVVPDLGLQYEKNVSDIELSSTKLSSKTIMNQSGPIKIYPNPTNGLVKIEGIKDPEASYNIINLKGETVRSDADFQSLSAGVYFLKIITNEGVFVKKVIKN